MKIQLLAIGKLKKKHWREAAEEYASRIRFYSQLKINELRDAKPSKQTIEFVQADESNRILEKIPTTAFIVALDKSGRQFPSTRFADFLKEKELYGPATICFCIGGPNGFSNDFLKRAHLVLALSSMTFPHELARVMLLEQIYRGFTILRGENYHK